jgi:hypothetical protein
MSANLSLFTVPLEILTQIFRLLEGHQIAKRATVSPRQFSLLHHPGMLNPLKICSYFKHVIESSIVLQYFIKLDMFGYTDISGSVDAAETPATRLNQLERHIDAWNNLDWVESSIGVPFPDQGLSILRHGIFVTFDIEIQLPHLIRGIRFRIWMLKDFTFPIHEIEIDPSNNHLVVVSGQVASVIGNYSSINLAELVGSSSAGVAISSLSISSHFPIIVLIREL